MRENGDGEGKVSTVACDIVWEQVDNEDVQNWCENSNGLQWCDVF